MLSIILKQKRTWQHMSVILYLGGLGRRTAAKPRPAWTMHELKVSLGYMVGNCHSQNCWLVLPSPIYLAMG